MKRHQELIQYNVQYVSVHVQFCSESQSFNVIAPIPWSKTYIHRIKSIFISIDHFEVSVSNSLTEPIYKFNNPAIHRFQPSFRSKLAMVIWAVDPSME